MKKAKKKISAGVPKPKILKKETRSAERRRFQGKVDDLNKSRDDLGVQVRQKTQELTVKEGQIRQGVDREKLAAKREQIAEEQIYIRTKAMEATIDGIFILEAQKTNFQVIYANTAFYSMTGYRKSEVIGKNYFLIDGVNSDLRIVEEIKKTLLQGKSFYGELLNFKKNGEKFWSLLRIAPVRDSQGDITHYVGIKTDTSKMKQRDLEIIEQREELLHVTRVGKLAEFVSSLAHEISQPLTAILSYAQAAQRILVKREPQLREILQYIINDDQRAAEVIRRLRVLLKKSEPELKTLDINVLINETVLLIATDASVRNNVLKVTLGNNLPKIYGDRIQLQQVLLNLISNSFDAMENIAGSGEMSITTTLKDHATIAVAVKDSGCGIPDENISKLFSHFFTSKVDGLGMGLSISRSIVEAHGGHLSGDNNPDRGATFYFTLPVQIKDAS